MSTASFEKALLMLRPSMDGDAALIKALLAALADLAADNLEPDAERVRLLLTQSCDKIVEEWPARPAICEAVLNWRRAIAFFPARDARAMRCFAIREAEKRLRREADRRDGNADYRSSSVSQ